MSHVPERTCAGCRRRRAKADLLRIGIDAQGRGTLDVTGRMPGRGAYLCAATAISCLGAAQRRHHLARSLRAGHGVIDYSELSADIARQVAAKEATSSRPR